MRNENETLVTTPSDMEEKEDFITVGGSADSKTDENESDVEQDVDAQGDVQFSAPVENSTVAQSDSKPVDNEKHTESKPSPEMPAESKPKETITTKTISEESLIPFETIEESNPNLTIGNSVSKQTGDYGISESEYIVTYVNGVETSRKLVKRSTIKEPINMIISVRSKKPTPEEDIAASKKAFALINDYPESKGLLPIIWDDSVYQMTIIRSKELLEMFSHTRPDGKPWHTVGYVNFEKIAGRYRSPESVVDAWINSTSPDENLLNELKVSNGAVAILKLEGSEHEYYWTLLGYYESE